MLRDSLLYALYEEVTENYKSITDAMKNIKLDYLTKDEAACFYEMLMSYYEDE